VLLDLHRHFGASRHAVTHRDLMRIIESDGVTIRSGDILCLHTGLAELALNLQAGDDHEALRRSCAVLDGGDEALLRWISESGIAAIAADNYAVEERRQALPADTAGALLPLHEHCLFKLGLPLGEMWFLSELARWLGLHGRHAFLLTAPPLHLPGAVGSPVNPIATV
jgi:kynurenine formamidase